MIASNITCLRTAINQAYLADEGEILEKLCAVLGNYNSAAVSDTAKTLIDSVRAQTAHLTPIEAFLREYQLTSEEGLVLMSMAEALLRIPDSETQDLFLLEKLTHADWQKHLHHSDSAWVNRASRALLLTHRSPCSDQSRLGSKKPNKTLV